MNKTIGKVTIYTHILWIGHCDTNLQQLPDLRRDLGIVQDRFQTAFALRRGQTLVDEVAAPATSGPDHAQPARNLPVVVAASVDGGTNRYMKNVVVYVCMF